MHLPFETRVIVSFPGGSEPDNAFAGLSQAEGWLRSRLWSYGPLQRGAPVGIVCEHAIPLPKWRHIRNPAAMLDGAIVSLGPRGTYRCAVTEIRLRLHSFVECPECGGAGDTYLEGGDWGECPRCRGTGHRQAIDLTSPTESG